MNNIWQLADIEEIKFAAAASMLAIRSQQQAVIALSQSWNEDSNDSADKDNEEEEATTKPTARLNRVSHRALKDKFLDRLGEVLAREKSNVQKSDRKDAKHVAATAWINRYAEDPITILIAKNEGLDNRDNRMAGRIQSWSR